MKRGYETVFVLSLVCSLAQSLFCNRAVNITFVNNAFAPFSNLESNECPADFPHCMRIEGIYNAAIFQLSGWAGICVNETTCMEDCKNLTPFLIAQINEEISTVDLSTIPIEIISCDSICCNTDNCNLNTIATIKSNQANSSKTMTIEGSTDDNMGDDGSTDDGNAEDLDDDDNGSGGIFGGFMMNNHLLVLFVSMSFIFRNLFS